MMPGRNRETRVNHPKKTTSKKQKTEKTFALTEHIVQTFFSQRIHPYFVSLLHPTQAAMLSKFGNACTAWC